LLESPARRAGQVRGEGYAEAIHWDAETPSKFIALSLVEFHAAVEWDRTTLSWSKVQASSLHLFGGAFSRFRGAARFPRRRFKLVHCMSGEAEIQVKLPLFPA
jgi:hypothetical protein